METRNLKFLTALTLCIPRVINTLSMNFYSMPKVLKRRAGVSEERHVLAAGRKSPIWDIYVAAHRRPNRHSRDSKTSLLLNINSSKYKTIQCGIAPSSPFLYSLVLTKRNYEKYTKGSVNLTVSNNTSETDETPWC